MFKVLLAALFGLIVLAVPAVSSAQTNTLGWIAFVQNSDIWTQELPDGVPQQLTKDATNGAPHISHSGEWIAFRKTDTIWVMNRTGQHAQAILGCELQWSTAADMVACFGEDGTIGVRRAPNFVLEPIEEPAVKSFKTYFEGMSWVEGQPKFVYGREDQTTSATALTTEAALWLVDADAHTQAKFFSLGNPSEDGILPASVPNLAQVFYWIDPMFSGSIQADGLPLNRVSTDGGTSKTIVDWMLVYRDYFSFSPNRQELAVIAGSYRGAWSSKQLQVIDLETNTPKTLTTKEVAASSPAWSPNGKQIAYAAMPDTGDLVGGNDARLGLRMRRIWVTNVDGTNVHALTKEEAYRDEYPQWSNDGQWILFARLHQPGVQDWTGDAPEIWKMRADGSALQKVASLEGMRDGAPTAAEMWFGYYGHLQWYEYYDWWQPTAATLMPATGGSTQNQIPLVLFGLLLLGSGSVLIVSRKKSV